MKLLKFVFELLFIFYNFNYIYSQSQTANVYYSKLSNKYNVIYEAINKDSLAYAKYTPSYEEKGWDYLTLSSSDKPESIYSDYIKHYGMGYLEGYITYKRIYDHYRNNNNYKFYKNNGVMPEYLEKFFKLNLEFIRKMGTKYGDNDPYFHEVYNYYNQLLGILDGYNTRVREEKKKNISIEIETITLTHFMAIISVGDIDELEYLKKENRPNYKIMT